MSNIAYAFVPLLVCMVADDWLVGDYMLLAYAAALSISSTWFHCQLATYADGADQRPDGGIAQHSDNAFTSLLTTTLCVRVIAGDDARHAAVWAPLLLLALEALLVWYPKVSRPACKRKFDAFMLLVIVAVMLGVGLRDGRDAVLLCTGCAVMSVACMYWLKGPKWGEGHAWWHVLSAVATALVWLSCH